MFDNIYRILTAIFEQPEPVVEPPTLLDLLFQSIPSGIAAALGAAITGLVTWLIFRKTVHRDESLREADKNTRESEKQIEHEKNLAIDAQSGLYKLSRWVNFLSNINNSIDDQFMDAYSRIGDQKEPCHILRPVAGQTSPPEEISTKEMQFLFKSGDFELTQRISLLQDRIVAIAKILDDSTKTFLEMDNFVRSQDGFEREFDGPFARTKLPPSAKFTLETYYGTINMLTHGILSVIDDDDREAADILAEYCAKAQEMFPDYFPKIKFDRVPQKRNAINEFLARRRSTEQTSLLCATAVIRFMPHRV